MKSFLHLVPILLALWIVLPSHVSAQRTCGTDHYLKEQQTQQFIAHKTPQTNEIIMIPVVFHVVHQLPSENISEAQIQTQLDVLNADFRRENPDADSTWPQAADAGIEFCLATVDPNGNPTTGITRTPTSVVWFSDDDKVKSDATGGKDPWPTTDYLNIWVCDLGPSLFGYAQFPGGDPATDGVVIHFGNTGTIGTVTPPFDGGRKLTHEIGHYLDLRHIWGDGPCGVDDSVADTPVSDDANYGCALGHVSCGSVDMVQNYMDYSDDACMNLFTAGQVARMRALFAPAGERVSLLNSNGCGIPVPITCDDGIQNGDETNIDCGGSCPVSDITVTINFDQLPELTSWHIVNTSGIVVASGGPYAFEPQGGTISVSNCLIEGCYEFTIFDADGNGICCENGEGSYTVTDTDGTILASGGQFTGMEETTSFCIETVNLSCQDGIQNGNETGIDCGGPDCAPCCTDNEVNVAITLGNNPTAMTWTLADTDGAVVLSGGPYGDQFSGSTIEVAGCLANGCYDLLIFDSFGGSAYTVTQGNLTLAAGTTTFGTIEIANFCVGDIIAIPSCLDGIQNGTETGVDCGGLECPACPTCTDITVTINTAQFPPSTSWSISDTNGEVVLSGGPYGIGPGNSSLTLTDCLEDGCYNLLILGSLSGGAITLTQAEAVIATNGGSVNEIESFSFCFGDVASPFTCFDGIQNGSETGVDCGGPDCISCVEECEAIIIDESDFTSWGIWNDGGVDCRRSPNDAPFANSDLYCVRLRDNSGINSSMTTDNLNLADFEQIIVDFNYLAISMESGEDFWLEVDTGNGFQMMASWTSGSDFQNNSRNFVSVTLDENFTSNTRFRFTCDASSNSDLVYIDDVVIKGCARDLRPATNITIDMLEMTTTTPKSNIENVKIYPNPAQELLIVDFELSSAVSTPIQVMITDMAGQSLIQRTWNADYGKQNHRLDLRKLGRGLYLLHLNSGEERVMKKFIVMK